MTVAFFFLVCLFENHSVHSELLFASQELPDAPSLFLCQYLASVSVFVYLSVNYWCEHFVCDTEARYGSIVGQVLRSISLVLDRGLPSNLDLPSTEA